MAHYSYSKNGQPYGFEQNVSRMEGSVQRGVLRAYLLMFAGLLVSALVAYLCYSSGFLNMLLMNPVLTIVLVIAQLVIVFAFTFMMRSASPAALKVLFFAYALTLGVSLSSLFYTYTNTTLFWAFAISAVYFGCLAFIGWTTKLDMTKIGNICLVGLVILIIMEVVMMFFPTPSNLRILAAVGLILFTGLTAYDCQNLNRVMAGLQGDPEAQEKWSVYFALQLYMDFINIFMYVLRLLGAGSSSRNR